MKITTLLFDLDGTLLPMNQEDFTNGYFKLLAKKMSARGYDAKQLVDSVWSGTAAMVKNNGSKSNEEAFWMKFVEINGAKSLEDRAFFEEFYAKKFDGAKAFCGFNPEVPKAIQEIKAMGYRLALATNPVFPKIATDARIRWAGLEPSAFEFYTTYENIGYCKPNLDYYREIIRRLQVAPSECLMVGNDVSEDMVAKDVGIHIFLVTDCLINKKDEDITRFPRGRFNQLLKMIRQEANKTS